MKIGLDVDGVFADFQLAFSRLANRMFGTPVKLVGEWPFWSAVASLGLTGEQHGRVWERLKASRNWWLDEVLPTKEASSLWAPQTADLYVDCLLCHEVYFVTSRIETAGWSAQAQTAEWFDRYGDVPVSVIVVGRQDQKGEAVKSLGITHFLDDNPNVLLDLSCAGVRVWAMDRLYNKSLTLVPRVTSIEGFLKEGLDDKEAVSGASGSHGGSLPGGLGE